MAGPLARARARATRRCSPGLSSCGARPESPVRAAAAIAPVDFAREVFALLGVYTPPVLDAWYQLYGHQDPSGFYALAGEQ